jgi:hypothetical protein
MDNVKYIVINDNEERDSDGEAMMICYADGEKEFPDSVFDQDFIFSDFQSAFVAAERLCIWNEDEPNAHKYYIIRLGIKPRIWTMVRNENGKWGVE